MERSVVWIVNPGGPIEVEFIEEYRDRIMFRYFGQAVDRTRNKRNCFATELDACHFWLEELETYEAMDTTGQMRRDIELAKTRIAELEGKEKV